MNTDEVLLVIALPAGVVLAGLAFATAVLRRKRKRSPKANGGTVSR